MKRTLEASARPLLIVAALGLAIQLLVPGLAMISYLSMPLFAFWAGWCVGLSPAGNAWRALLAGLLVLVLAFLLCTGLAATIDPARVEPMAAADGEGWLAQRPLLAWWFMLLLTTLVLAPVAGLIALLGGALARRTRVTPPPT